MNISTYFAISSSITDLFAARVEAASESPVRSDDVSFESVEEPFPSRSEVTFFVTSKYSGRVHFPSRTV